MEVQWHLNEQEFFSGLSAEKKIFLSHSRKREIKRNELLFVEGDTGDTVFYLHSGEVRISHVTPCGKESIVFIRRAGEMFGLAEAIGGSKRACSARAITACRLYELKRGEFEELLAQHWALSRRVMEILGRRLRYLGEQMENLMFCDVTTRLLKLLLSLSCYKQTDNEVWNASDAIPVKLTQEQIASMIGSCQQTVSEILKQFEKEGLIRISRNRREITILKPATLV